MPRVVLVVPFGVDDSIFPWGVHSLARQLQFADPQVEVDILDLRDDEALRKTHSECQKQLIQLAYILGMMSQVADPDNIRGDIRRTAVAAGKAESSVMMYRLLANKNVFAKDFGQSVLELPETQALFQNADTISEAVTERLHEIGRTQLRDTALLGFSVYDMTLLECLFLASTLKQELPQTPVILGGDYFDPHSAATVAQAINVVDAVVVGYGEKSMVPILKAIGSGVQLASLDLPGVYSSSRATKTPDVVAKGPRQQPYAFPVTEPFVGSLPEKNEILCSAWPENVLRLYSVRGCSWNRCTFCFSNPATTTNCLAVSDEHLLRSLDEVLDARGAVLKDLDLLDVNIDSDESDLSQDAKIMQYLRVRFPDQPIRLSFAARAATIGKSPEFLLSLRDFIAEGRQVHCEVGVESLNHETLKNMRKGVSALGNAYAIKALHDAGAYTIGNYFAAFPLETRSSVAAEADMLVATAHLLTPPRHRFGLIAYMPTCFDKITADPARYSMKAKPHPCPWLKDQYGLDLPFASQAFDFSFLPQEGEDNSAALSWYRLVYGYQLPFCVSAQQWNNAAKLIDTEVDDPVHNLRAKLLLGLQRRFFDFNLEEAEMTVGRKEGDGVVESGSPCEFQLDGNVLRRRSAPPFGDSSSIELDSNELEVLRFLYCPRTYPAVVSHLSHRIPEADLKDILDRHVAAKSIVRQDGSYLAVFNDPVGMLLSCRTRLQ